MQKIIITGNSDFARLVREYADEIDGFHCEAFTCDGEYISDSMIDGIPVVAFEEIRNHFPADEVKLILAIGYKKLGEVRRDLYLRYSGLGYEFTNYIHPSASIDKNSVMGSGNIIFERVIIQKRVRLGNGNLIWPRAIISHDDTVGDFNTFCANSVIAGFVNIASCSFFGTSSVVKDKISVGNNNLIGACAYVSRSTRDNQVCIPPQSSSLKDAAETLAAYL